MKSLTLLNLIVFILTSSSVLASLPFTQMMGRGGDMSGGGYVVVCNDSNTELQTYELLDYFEAKHIIRNFKLIDFSKYEDIHNQNDVFKIAKSIIEDRVYSWSPLLSIELAEVVDIFKEQSLAFVQRGIINDIDDDSTIIDPVKGCKKTQVAVQVKDPAPLQYRVLIDDFLWKKLDKVTKIGLIIHEAIYKVGLNQGHENSNKIRILHSLIVNAEAKLSFEEKRTTLQHLDYNITVDLDYHVKLKDGSDQKLSFPVLSSSIKYSDGYEARVCRNIYAAKECEAPDNMSHYIKLNDSSKLTFPRNTKIVTMLKNSKLTFELTDTDHPNSGSVAFYPAPSNVVFFGPLLFDSTPYLTLRSAGSATREFIDEALKDFQSFKELLYISRPLDIRFLADGRVTAFKTDKHSYFKFANQEFELKEVSLLPYNIDDPFIILAQEIKLTINNKELMLGKFVSFPLDKKIISVQYLGEPQKIKIGSKVYSITNVSDIHFDFEGNITKIIEDRRLASDFES